MTTCVMRIWLLLCCVTQVMLNSILTIQKINVTIPTLKAEIEVQPPEYVVSTVLIVSTVVQSCTADIRATPHIVQGEARYYLTFFVDMY